MSGTGIIEAAFRGQLGRFALDAAFNVPMTGVTALFGPSGCGKTTVLRCLAGLTRVSEGRCRVDGRPWQDEGVFLPPHRRPIGYVFQEASLFPHLSVERNLLYGTRGARPDPRAGQVDFDETVALLGLWRLLDRAPRHLSGGERQRVAIGRSLLSRPQLLLMDEPLSALDRSTREEILPFLEALRDRLELPILYVSHELGEVERLADTLVLMAQGRVIACGPLGSLQGDPNLPLALARDASVSLDARIAELHPVGGLTAVDVDGGRLLVPGLAGSPGERRRVRIAAGDVSLSRSVPQDSTILNSLPVRIASAKSINAAEHLIVLRTGHDGEGATLLSRITRYSWERLGLAEGMVVHAQIKSVALVTPGRE